MTTRLFASFEPAYWAKKTRITLLLFYAFLIFAAGCFPSGLPWGKFEYTSIFVTYPGFVAHYKSYPGSPSTEHVYDIDVTNADGLEWSITLIGKDGEELALTNLDVAAAEVWARTRLEPAIEKDSHNRITRIAVAPDHVVMEFDEQEKIKSLHISGWQNGAKVELTTPNGTVTWPCSREKLSDALGNPTSVEIKKQIEKRI